MARHRLVVVLVDNVLPMDMAIPMHVFAREASEAYDVATASPDGKPVPVAGGMTIVSDGGLDLVRRAETVIVPGYAGAADQHVGGATARALGVAAARRGTRMISICSGAFALAQAGILDGLTATTHWSLCHALAVQHPQITVEPSVLFVDNGAVLTSGGVTAGVDLCLHVLAKDLGPSAARQVSRRLVMAPRDSDQRQFMETTVVPPADDTIAAAQQWMLACLAEPLTVAQMAARARMSERSFHRRFTERTGTSPLAWLRHQRIARAKELLESSDLPVEHIAGRVGLGTSANLRVQFRRATSLSPQEHRRQFSFAGSTHGATPHDSAV